MMNRLNRTALVLLLFCTGLGAQTPNYPKGYFRNPLNIPMQLVANFGELRANHWHMGLDIRTQQRENLPVHAAAEGYIARVKIEPGGFGRAIYINHPNGLTTLYAHLNNFEPALERWVRQQQYEQESWAVELALTPDLFPVKKGQFFAWSGNTGGSQGPHVHFEIRETATDKCLNPLLFGFPIADAVPPTLTRLGLYDRGRSTYAQSPRLLSLKRSGGVYVPVTGPLIRTGSDRISFALAATDRFSASTNPNGIYSARILMDGALQSEFILDSISYDETRYMNAHTDYRLKAAGGAWLQHLSRLPGDTTDVYTSTPNEGVLHLTDTQAHEVRIEVRDAARNLSVIRFTVRHDPALATAARAEAEEGQLLPQQVNVFESETFELFTSEYAVYDTVDIRFSQDETASEESLSPRYTFLGATIPTHDSVTVRIRLQEVSRPDRVVIRSVAGSRTVVEKAAIQGDWAWARFRQFGSFQAFEDSEPPTVNAPPSDLRRAARIVFTPRDNFHTIRSFRAEVDGQWLRFTNDKGRTWIYAFDEHFPRGTHELKVLIEDEAGNVLERSWNVVR